MELLNKKVIKKWGKKYYLLGEKDGEQYWLEEGHFDCDWYWGVGYVEVFNRPRTDIKLHTHFDSLFLSNGYDEIFNYFDKNTLTQSDQWRLLELMKCIYNYRNFSDMLHRGGAGISTISDNEDLIKAPVEYEKINKFIIPRLLDQVYELLGGIANV